jgi:hypothetical protein
VLENIDRWGVVLARPIVLISYLFWLAAQLIFSKDYSPSSSPPSRPFTGPMLGKDKVDIRPRSSLRGENSSHEAENGPWEAKVAHVELEMSNERREWITSG